MAILNDPGLYEDECGPKCPEKRREGLRVYPWDTNTLVKIFHLDAVTSGTEYSQALEKNTKEFTIYSRKNGNLLLRYGTVDAEQEDIYCNTKLCVKRFFKDQTLYLTSDVDNDTIVITDYYTL